MKVIINFASGLNKRIDWLGELHQKASSVDSNSTHNNNIGDGRSRLGHRLRRMDCKSNRPVRKSVT